MTEPGTFGDALALHEGVDVVDEPGRRGDELVGGKRADLGRDALDLVEERGHALGGGADARDRGLGLGEDAREVLDELGLGRLVDDLRGPRRGCAAISPGACWMPGSLRSVAGVGEEEAEVLGRGLDLGRGDEGVDVGEERDGALDHLLERQVGDALHQALGRGGDARDVRGRGRQQRVGLGVAVEGRGRGIGDLGEVDVEASG